MLQGIIFAERLTTSQSKGATSKCCKGQCQMKYKKKNRSNHLKKDLLYILNGISSIEGC